MDEANELTVKVLFFGATADVVATRSMALDLPRGSSSSDAFEAILEKYPTLASHKLLFAVNEQYADGSEKLNNDDELAVFTAVSGG